MTDSTPIYTLAREATGIDPQVIRDREPWSLEAAKARLRSVTGTSRRSPATGPAGSPRKSRPRA